MISDRLINKRFQVGQQKLSSDTRGGGSILPGWFPLLSSKSGIVIVFGEKRESGDCTAKEQTNSGVLPESEHWDETVPAPPHHTGGMEGPLWG